MLARIARERRKQPGQFLVGGDGHVTGPRRFRAEVEDVRAFLDGVQRRRSAASTFPARPSPEKGVGGEA